MRSRQPRPLCGYELGYGWIDTGTLPRTRLQPPGPAGVLETRPPQTLTVPSDVPGKLLLAAQAGLPKLPQEIRQEVAALLSVESMAIVAGSVLVLAGAQAVGVGLIFDVVLLGLSIALIGAEAIKAARSFQRFYSLALIAQTESDFSKAGEEFAKAVSMLGVNAVIALLARQKLRPRGRLGHADTSALRASWYALIDGIKFAVPRDRGMLWSKLDSLEAAAALARRKGLVSLEMILKEEGFVELYSKQFGIYENAKRLGLEDVTGDIWRRVSGRYAKSLEGKVTAFVRNRELDRSLRANKEPVLIDELEEIANIMTENSRIISVEMIDLESGRSWHMLRSEVLKAAGK
jgi:hypothetical protein